MASPAEGTLTQSASLTLPHVQPPNITRQCPLQATICLTGRGIENIEGGLGKLGGSLHRVLPARSEMVTTLTAQMSDLPACD